jgi:hypothetical protein
MSLVISNRHSSVAGQDETLLRNADIFKRRVGVPLHHLVTVWREGVSSASADTKSPQNEGMEIDFKFYVIARMHN